MPSQTLSSYYKFICLYYFGTFLLFLCSSPNIFSSIIIILFTRKHVFTFCVYSGWRINAKKREKKTNKKPSILSYSRLYTIHKGQLIIELCYVKKVENIVYSFILSFVRFVFNFIWFRITVHCRLMITFLASN